MPVAFREADIFDSAAAGDLAALKQHIRARVSVRRSLRGLDEHCPWSGLTALHFAAANGKVRAAKLLLENGADPDVKTKDGKMLTALHLSCEHGRFQMTRFLLDLFESKDEISATDWLGNSVVHYACKSGDVRVVELFFKKFSKLEIAELVEPGEYSDHIDEYLDGMFHSMNK